VSVVCCLLAELLLQADITAKGESVANLADILGTLAGIVLSKWKLPMVPTFVVLSCGYLLASRKEVDSVELPYLNRARLALTSTHFLKTGGGGDVAGRLGLAHAGVVGVVSCSVPVWCRPARCIRQQLQTASNTLTDCSAPPHRSLWSRRCRAWCC
jgi:hypothetical protein